MLFPGRWLTDRGDAVTALRVQRSADELPSRMVMARFAQRVREYPFAERVYGRVDGDRIIRLWTVLSTDSAEDRAKIYEEQGRMLDECPDMLFDFFVLSLPRLKRPLSEVIPSRFVA